MAKMFSENAAAVLVHLQANQGKNETAKDIAEATGIAPRSVNGTITGLAKKGLVERQEVGKDDAGKPIKYIVLTSKGASVDPAMEKPEA